MVLVVDKEDLTKRGVEAHHGNAPVATTRTMNAKTDGYGFTDGPGQAREFQRRDGAPAIPPAPAQTEVQPPALPPEPEDALPSERASIAPAPARLPPVEQPDVKPRTPAPADLTPALEQAPAAPTAWVPRPTKHDDQGVDAAIEAVKRAEKRLTLARMAKERLRVKLRVPKLRDYQGNDQRTRRAIATVRDNVTKAKERAAKAQSGARSIIEGNPKRVEREIAQRDLAMGHSDKDADARRATTRARRVAAEKRTRNVTKVMKEVRFADAKAHRLVRSMDGLSGGNVGSQEFDFKLGVSVGADVGTGSKLSLGGGLRYHGTRSVGDDRKFRVTHSLGAYASADAGVAEVVSAALGGELTGSRTEVFDDVEHWAAVMAVRFSMIRDRLQGRDRDRPDAAAIRETINNEYEGEDADELMSVHKRADKSPTDVVALKQHVGANASAVGVGGELGYTQSLIRFKRDGKTKSADQEDRAFSVSFGALSLSATWTQIRGHANPDNNGKYWNIAVKLGGRLGLAAEQPGADKVLSGWEATLKEALNGTGDTAKRWETAKALMGGWKPALEAFVPKGVAADAEVSGARELVFNFVKTSGDEYRLQYRRDQARAKISGGLSVAVAAGVNVSGGASKSTALMNGETLGANTLTYLLTVANGLRARGPAGVKELRKYYKTHKSEVWAMLQHIGNGSGAASELLDVISDAPGRPNGMNEQEWKPTQAAHKASQGAAKTLLDRCKRDLAGSRASVVEDDKLAPLVGLLDTYLKHIGKANRLQAAHSWA